MFGLGLKSKRVVTLSSPLEFDIYIKERMEVSLSGSAFILSAGPHL